MVDRSGLSEIEVCKLVQLVQERPEIWDKTCNKDNAEKRRAWIEIFEQLDGRPWDDIPEAERKKLEETYQGKWKNIRDTFIKSMRGSQQYKYHEILKFLAKNLEGKKQGSPSPPVQAGPSHQLTSAERKSKQHLLGRTNFAAKRKRLKIARGKSTVRPIRIARKPAPEPGPELEYIPPIHTRPIPHPTNSYPMATKSATTATAINGENVTDEDEQDTHFFRFLKPIIRNFSSDQKLRFWSEVLQLTIQIKNNSMEMNGNSPALHEPYYVTPLKNEIFDATSDIET